MFYAASTNGFYDPAFHGDAIPDDAVAITQALHARLLAGQSEGATIMPDNDGRPTLRRPPAAERRAALHEAIKSEAGRRIVQISPLWRQSNDQREPSEEGARRFERIDAIRAASDRIGELLDETSAADLDAFMIEGSPLWPEFD
ncbi:hypothetical protein [Aurantiacibacter suaedae]|uniref:hypothetical protein n=1 Tax=Aurantiacibacter suaedae TaxID=2545755 RepID=UPI0010F6A47B|nr:hypothetical protein [Aurantiacibacter suaedae]